MQRCIELAELGAGSVSPNPMVGAVIVHEEIYHWRGLSPAIRTGTCRGKCVNQVLANYDDAEELIKEFDHLRFA